MQSIKSTVILFLLVATAAAAPRIDLSLPEPIVTVQGPTPNVDVDGDGLLDIVNCSVLPGEWPAPSWIMVQVERNLGGTFAAAQIDTVLSIATGSATGQAYILAAFDFTGDGRADLALGYAWLASNCAANALLTVPNRGNGTFGAGTAHFVQFGDMLHADLDGDGLQDFVVSPMAPCVAAAGPEPAAATTNTISVLRNLGAGHFTPAETYTINGEWPVGIVIADLNADGHLDIATSRSVYLPGIGGGFFGLPVGYGVPSDGTWILADDFRNDHRTDLIIGGDAVHVLLNEGASFTQTTYPVTADGYRSYIDLDSDGARDLVSASHDMLSVLHGDGAGGFTLATYALPGASSGVRTGDFNGDGLPDFLGGDWVVTPLLSAGGASYANGRSYVTGAYTEVRDVDGDGRSDLVVGQSTGSAVCRSLGNGEFHAPLYLPQRTIVSVAPQVITGPGTTVGLVSPGFYGIKYQPVSPGGTVGAETVIPFATAPESAYCTAIQVRDLDGDTRPDLAIARSNGVSIFRNTGAAVPFSASEEYARGIAPNSIAVADFDADGDPDVVTDGWSSLLVLLRNQGDGHFAPPEFLPAGGTPAVVAAADFDADGAADLAVQLGSEVRILRNHGDATFEIMTSIPFTGGSSYPAVVPFDCDGDGDVDLVLSANGNTLYLARNRGNGTFDPPAVIVTTGGWVAIHVIAADFDADGATDLATTGFPTGQRNYERRIDIYRNEGDGTFTHESSFEHGTYSQYLSAGDVNGDRKIDVVLDGMLLLNRSSTVSPVVVSELQAEWTDFGVRLTWRLAAAERGVARGLRVEKSSAAAGPFREVQALLPPESSSLVDPGAVPGTWYRLIVVAGNGAESASAAVEVAGTRPSRTALQSVRSNAAGRVVDIRYTLATPGSASDLTIYDIAGRSLQRWHCGPVGAGTTLVQWDGRTNAGTPSARGVYVVRLDVAGASTSRKFVKTWR